MNLKGVVYVHLIASCELTLKRNLFKDQSFADEVRTLLRLKQHNLCMGAKSIAGDNEGK